MIKKFSFASPKDVLHIPTNAVVLSLSESNEKIDFGKVTKDFPLEWECELLKNDMVFGLGENVRGINKRGFSYTSWCSDTPNQTELSHSLYGAHNFFIIFNPDTKLCKGLFFDTAGKITFDVGFSDAQIFSVKAHEPCDIYLITAESENEVLHSVSKQFRMLIGKSYIPPRWAFGFQQSRWGYKTEQDVRKVFESYKNAELPLEAICLDIDYMESYKDFTVDKKKFPNLKKLSDELKESGGHLIPIIDAGVKIQEGYDVYEEGIKNDFFCKKQNGSPFTAGVWPGRSHFPDFLNPQVRKWFGHKYSFLVDSGIEGFWNDMNEPALFYSDESLLEAFKKIKEFEGKNLDIDSFFDFTQIAGSTFNRADDYARFFHNTFDSNGKAVTICHDKVHNLYGANMTRAAFESLAEMYPQKRFLLYSRASCIGSHRYGGIWTGDNISSWEHLRQEVKMLPGLNLSGFLYSGADIGGFGNDTSADLVLRWLSLGVFTPLMRNHSAWNTREQECYAFGETNAFKNILSLRYALLPYLYSEFVQASLLDEMFIKPLGFVWEDDLRALHCEDELLVGRGILIAPVCEQNALGRMVYIPEDMTQVTWQNEKFEEKPICKGDHFIEVPLDTVVFFIRKDFCIPTSSPAKNSTLLDYNHLNLLGSGTCDFYEDDGVTSDVHLEGRIKTLQK